MVEKTKILTIMAAISNTAKNMPASAIRKLTPFADKAEAEGVKVYHLNMGAPDIKSPDCALEAIRNFSGEHVSYSTSAGLMELRKGMSEKYYKPLGIDLNPKEIIITDGGSEAVHIAVEICCNDGDEIIAMEPFYTNYNTFCFLHGVTLKTVPTDIHKGFGVPAMEQFEKLITPRTKAILLCNPGNPTGTLYSKEDMLKIGELVLRHDLFLIADEVYREFCYTQVPFFSAMNIPGAEQHVILVDSVSKRYNLCGCRIGCIASHNAEVMAAALKYAQMRLCAPVLGQWAAIGALDTPQEYFDAVKEEYIKRRDFTIKALNEMEGVFSPTPDGAFYTIAALPVDDAEKFARWMLEEFRYEGQTTMITPAASFYRTPGAGHNHVRIAYVLEIPELRKAMKVLEEGIKAYNAR